MLNMLKYEVTNNRTVNLYYNIWKRIYQLPQCLIYFRDLIHAAEFSDDDG